jgi:hypothetical protein
MLTGYLRKGQNRPALTGRAARHAEMRTTGKPLSQYQRALILVCNADRIDAAGYMRAVGFHGEVPAGAPAADVEYEVRRFSSPFGKACAKAYRVKYGREPYRHFQALVDGVWRRVRAYDDVADLHAGALAYKRMREYLAAEQNLTADQRHLVNA